MWLEIITLLVGITALILSIFIALRGKEVFRPTLAFKTGLSCLYGEIPKKAKVKKADISTLIYGADVTTKHDIVAFCHYILTNNSRLAVANIILQLEYASKYLVRNEENRAIIEGIDYEIFASFPRTKGCEREVSLLGPIVQVRYTIPNLRIGETIVISDAMKFVNLKPRKEANDENSIIGSGLLRNLEKVDKLLDFCIVDAFIHSDSCSPIVKRINVLWLNADSEEKLLPLIQKTVNAIWGGHYPRPGLYFNWLGKKTLRKEYGETIIVKLDRLDMLKDRGVWLENPLESDRSIVELGMPPWNYYQFSEGKIPGRLVRPFRRENKD